jgi:four helix bundle protein
MAIYKYDLEERLIQISGNIILSCNKLNGSFAFQHLSKQLMRSTTSSALNYGEAQSAESKRYFLHKMKFA